MLFTGLSDQMFGLINLPFSLTGAGAPNCDLLVSPEVPLSFVTNAGGRATVTVPVPAARSLVGLNFYQQATILDARANQLGNALSNAARILIGGQP